MVLMLSKQQVNVQDKENSQYGWRSSMIVAAMEMAGSI